ncbi:MAG: hypothetical protein GY801_09505 [bacterium]|nr:hypothetical protein [bacterium]
MYKEILTKGQRELLAAIQKFANDYYLVGGTAIALHIGHRRSIDFDLFTSKTLQREKIKQTLDQSNIDIQQILHEDGDQLHLMLNFDQMSDGSTNYLDIKLQEDDE